MSNTRNLVDAVVLFSHSTFKRWVFSITLAGLELEARFMYFVTETENGLTLFSPFLTIPVIAKCL